MQEIFLPSFLGSWKQKSFELIGKLDLSLDQPLVFIRSFQWLHCLSFIHNSMCHTLVVCLFLSECNDCNVCCHLPLNIQISNPAHHEVCPRHVLTVLLGPHKPNAVDSLAEQLSSAFMFSVVLQLCLETTPVILNVFIVRSSPCSAELSVK